MLYFFREPAVASRKGIGMGDSRQSRDERVWRDLAAMSAEDREKLFSSLVEARELIEHWGGAIQFLGAGIDRLLWPDMSSDLEFCEVIAQTTRETPEEVRDRLLDAIPEEQLERGVSESWAIREAGYPEYVWSRTEISLSR